MRKTVKNQIMKKPLFALALIAFGIGIALYTNVGGFKEGNATMGARPNAPPATATDTTKKASTDKATTNSAQAKATTDSVPSTSVPSTTDAQAVINDALKKLGGSAGAIDAINTFMGKKPNEPVGNMVQPPM